jgi:hypothetical protein
VKAEEKDHVSNSTSNFCGDNALFFSTGGGARK